MNENKRVRLFLVGLLETVITFLNNIFEVRTVHKYGTYDRTAEPRDKTIFSRRRPLVQTQIFRVYFVPVRRAPGRLGFFQSPPAAPSPPTRIFDSGTDSTLSAWIYKKISIDIIYIYG